MRKKERKKKKWNLFSPFPLTPRGIGVEMGCGVSLPAPPGHSCLLPLLPVLAQALPWATGVSLLQLRCCLKGNLCSGPAAPRALLLLQTPLWGPCSCSLLGCQWHITTIAENLCCSQWSSWPFWASDCPCEPQHTASCVPGPATSWVSPKHWIQSPVEIKNSKHPLVRKIWVWSLLETYIK